MYNVLRKIETGERILVVRFHDLSEAKQILMAFGKHWPGEYAIQESVSGTDVELDSDLEG